MSATRQRLAGDPPPEAAVARVLRVDHAGEYGAARIYAGQLAVLRRSDTAPVLREMQAQEQQHLDRFAELIVRRRVRPTAMLPLWHLAGFALGAATAALGERAAMACTVAVEEAIRSRRWTTRNRSCVPRWRDFVTTSGSTATSACGTARSRRPATGCCRR